MKSLPQLALLLLMFCVAGCVAPEASKRIQSRVTALEYNSVSSTYEKRPTFAEIQTTFGKKRLLQLTMNSYGSRTIWIAFHEDHISEYIAAIDKFEEWKNLATQRNEAISKEIATITFNVGAKLVFAFHSARFGQHFLQITVGGSGLLGTTTIDSGMMFDSRDLESLKSMIKEFPNAKLENLDAIYK